MLEVEALISVFSLSWNPKSGNWNSLRLGSSSFACSNLSLSVLETPVDKITCLLLPIFIYCPKPALLCLLLSGTGGTRSKGLLLLFESLIDSGTVFEAGAIDTVWIPVPVLFLYEAGTRMDLTAMSCPLPILFLSIESWLRVSVLSVCRLASPCSEWDFSWFW